MVERSPRQSLLEPDTKKDDTAKDLKDISVGDQLKKIYCWGFGKYGQVGSLGYQYCIDSVEVNFNLNIPSPETKKIPEISQLLCGEFNSGFLTSDGILYLFGKNTFGQLGNGNEDICYIPTPVKLDSKIKFEKVAVGGEHVLALSNTGELFSWGLNVFGQLGLGTTENKNVPSLIEKFAIITKSDESRNILKEIPLKIVDTEKIIEIAAGAQHSLLLTSANIMYSCGFSKNGCLGYFTGENDPIESTLFTKVPTKSTSKKYSKISCGVNHSGCVIGLHEVLIWGRGDPLTFESIARINLQASLVKQNLANDKSTNENTNSMATVGTATKDEIVSSSRENIMSIAEIQIGENFFIIRTENGDLYSCGTNEYGQLGIGSQQFKKMPERVLLNDKVKKVTVGYGFVYALSTSNKIYGWGNNRYGQLLDIANEKIFIPKEISQLSELNPVSMQCGAYHCIIQTNNAKKEKPNKMFNFNDYKLIQLNKHFDPVIYEQELNMINTLVNKQKTLEETVSAKDKEIERLKKSIEEKQQIEKKSKLYPERGKRKTEKNSKITNPAMLFEEEIKYEDLVFPEKCDIGVGTFGEVKRGFWRKTLVAVKFLKKSMENEEENIKSFVEELNLLKRLRHPNILLYIGACTSGPYYFLVTEYCENGNLFDFLHTNVKKVNLSNRDRLRIALEIAKGVNYLHSFNPPILHRDLKSLNILLDKNLQVKIADFGWARLRDIHMTKQRGTFQWMAPEVIKKNSYSEKADVFSFGIIMWELWVQEPPYKNIDRIQVAKKVAQDKNFRPKLLAEIPNDIKNIMQVCWHHDPEIRPCFADIITELESIEREDRIV